MSKFIQQNNFLSLVQSHNEWLRYVMAFGVLGIKNFPESGEKLELESVTVQNATVVKWDLSRAIFINCQFTRVQFGDCQFTDTVFKGCDFENSSFRYCNFQEATFSDCSASSLNLQHSAMVRSEVENTDLRHTDFTYSTLVSTSFVRSDLRHAIFDQTHFRNTGLFEVKLFNTRHYKFQVDFVAGDVDMSQAGDGSTLVNAEDALQKLRIS